MYLMKRFLTVVVIGSIVIAGLFLFLTTPYNGHTNSQGEYEFSFVEVDKLPLFDGYDNWERPEGPATVALQVGHWKLQEMPEEFENLKRTGGGTRGGGKAEWEVALTIAELTAEILSKQGVQVEILPATIPPDYWADVLVSIHADGSEDTSATGYKVAAPRRDRTEKATDLASAIEQAYGAIVPLKLDPNISRNMTGYYAFNWRRYEYSMHPMTVGTIVETGFLTNPSDRTIIVNKPELSAQGIANGILAFLSSENLIDAEKVRIEL